MTVAVAASSPAIDLTFFLPSERLHPFVTTYYHLRVDPAGGDVVEDWLHPEWANIRLARMDDFTAAIGDEEPAALPDTIVAGPTSKTTRFRVGAGRSWGIGLLPLGWAQLVGLNASHYVDRLTDAAQDEALARFAGLRKLAFAAPDDLAQEVRAIDAALLAMLDRAQPADGRIAKVHALLVDENITSVAQLCEGVGMTTRTLERFCKRWFGFSPRVLLARQRFLRCLGRFMLDPSMNWLATLDDHYYDQAHFVRDFRKFMTMSPSEYARLPHPVLMAAARARQEMAGAPMQVLHKPQAGA